MILEFKSRFRNLDLRKETRRGTSVYNGVFNLLVLQGARDWMTGNVPQHDDLDDHHIVPASWGGKNLAGDAVHTILNRTPLSAETNRHVINDQLPNEYLPQMIKSNGENNVRAILESHFISPSAQAILLRDPFTPDDFEEFITERQKTLQEAIENLLIKERLDLPPQMRELDEKVEQIELALRKTVLATLDGDTDKLPQHIAQKVNERIVAFSGEHEYGGEKVTEASLNGFPSSQIADRIQEDPYRFLICADKFQTGYDEPLLHTMYVDKPLSSIKAVQTLSRLNRAHPQKHDVFVLDFLNDTDTIQNAFDRYYRTTILSKETDPNKLHDLKSDLDGYQVYGPEHIDELVKLYLDGADRDKLDPILDACVAVYNENLDEDGQVYFKGKAKAFCRTYGFLGSILPPSYKVPGWEKLSIFLNFLIPKLPAPKEEDLSKGILESIDMDSYRVEKQAAMQIQLADENAEIDPVPSGGGGWKPEPELDRLSNILKTFNDQFGNISWNDEDRVRKLITEEIPAKVAADKAYQNARKQGDKGKARIEHDAALLRVMVGLLKDDTELFKQYSDNAGFKRWLADTVFGLTFEEDAA